ncbi:MAG TPA: glycosyltransferase [Flavobacteriales bacterium]|nr:glycosyltransferase [Flavobacteriales bacterium]
MPKVLRILNRFNVGGPTYNAVYLSKYLPAGYETLLMGGEIDPSEESSLFIARNEGLSPLVIPEMRRSINPFADRKALKKIKEIMGDYKPDIVHTHASKAGVLGRKAAFSLKVPVVVHTFHGHVFHSYFNPVKTALIKRFERSLARKSSAIVAISEEQKHELVNIHRICEASKMHVIPLGFDLEKFAMDTQEKRRLFRQKYWVADDEIAVTIVGRLVPVKNHMFFVRVMENVLKRSKRKLRFFIVGDGEERQNILNKLAELKIDHCYWPVEQKKAVVTLTSWSKEVDVVNAGSDIIVLTSLNEGTPVSLIEAQAAGKPIVSTRTGGINNIVLEGESAFLTGVDQVDLFTENLTYIIENDDIRKKMELAGRDFVMERFTYKRLCADMAVLYETLLQGGHK